MPRVKIDYVVSFSSEDSEHRADNLLAHEVSKKKWLCNVGELSCSVVLQLSRAVQISTVNIGVCHAALVEVLVGRSEKPNDPFEVLVPSSVFLSPAESRREAGAGAERVRSFGGAQLGAARAARWDRVRVVCSQPYNKHCKYGLSFIHIFEPEDRTQPEPEPRVDVPKPVAPSVPRRLMAIDNFSSDEDEFKPGELFAKHQQRISDAGSTDTGAQIRQATSQALKNISDSATKLVKTPLNKTNTNRHNQSNNIDTNRQKDSLMYTDDDELPHSKIDAIVQRHKDDKEHEGKNNEPSNKVNSKERKQEANTSRDFREFLDNDDKRKDSSNSRSKESSRDDRRKDLNNSKRSKDHSNDDRRKDHSSDNRRKDMDTSGSKDSFKDDKRKDLNNSRSKETSKNDRRNKDDERTPFLKKIDDSSQNRDSKKRPRPDDEKDTGLRAGPASAAPHALLRGVVFALSGYANPRRARLRAAALAMGARCEPDWGPACTHLICAFPNTPKLRRVRAVQSDCIAVTGEWIESCCAQRRLLPWQWFATEPCHRVPPPEGAMDDGADSTECDTDDEIEKVLRKQKRQRVDSSPRPHKSPQPHSSRDASPKPHPSRDVSPKPHSSQDASPKPHSSQDASPKPHSSRDRSPQASTSKGTSKVQTTPKNTSHNSSSVSNNSDVVFLRDERIQGNITIDSDSDETDEEKPASKEKVDKERILPDFFEGYTFLIDDNVEEAGFDVELLSRYVKAYGGVVLDASQVDSESEISFVVCARAAGGRRVRPDWVWRCHERQTLCDTTEFAL